MATIPGSVQVTGFIAPTDSNDTYATHDSIYGRGGWREVISLADRDAITTDRRREGMVVYVKNTGLNYQLYGGTDNTYWKQLKTSFSTGSTFPTTPNTGDFFVHDTVGRKIIFTYSGSQWYPVQNLDNINMYVDTNLGSNAKEKGTASGSSAFKTISYAISQCPKYGNGFTAYIYVAGGANAYTEQIDISNYMGYGNSYYPEGFNIIGETSVVASGTCSASNNTNGYSEITFSTNVTALYTDSLVGNMLNITSGSAIYSTGVIVANTSGANSSITVRGMTSYVSGLLSYYSPNINTPFNFTVNKNTTKLENTSIVLKVDSSKNVVIKNMSISISPMSMNSCIEVSSDSSAMFLKCDFANSYVLTTNFSKTSLLTCYLNSGVTCNYDSRLKINQCLVSLPTNITTGVIVRSASSAEISGGTITPLNTAFPLINGISCTESSHVSCLNYVYLRYCTNPTSISLSSSVIRNSPAMVNLYNCTNGWYSYSSNDQDIITITSSYTATSNDDTILCNTQNNSINLTMPITNASGGGKVITVKKTSASNTVTVLPPAGGYTINGSSSASLTINGSAFVFQANGMDWTAISSSSFYTDADARLATGVTSGHATQSTTSSSFQVRNIKFLTREPVLSDFDSNCDIIGVIV